MGGSGGSGGGIYNDGMAVNATISGNSTGSGGASSIGGNGAGGSGGGIRNGNGALDSAKLRNPIVASNNAAGTGPALSGTYASQGHNLIGKSNGSTGFTNGVNNDQVGSSASPLDAKPGPLANNGGPTQTHALLPDSPAINTLSAVTTLSGAITHSALTLTLADATAFPAGVGFVLRIDSEQMLVTAKSGNTLTVTRAVNGTTAAAHHDGAGVHPAFDQRGSGFPRKVDTAVDIGAFEVQNATPTIMSTTIEVQKGG